MRYYKANIKKRFLIVFPLAVIIFLIILFKDKVTTSSFISALVVSLSLILLQLPYFEIVCFIIDNDNKDVIIVRNNFLLKKTLKKYKIDMLNYKYKLEYAGLPTKEYVFTIFEEGKKVIRVRANSFGNSQLKNFVTDLDSYKV